jgi:putative ABC transport system permease protein
MFLNYLKIALRNLRKHRVVSFINLFGLTVGLTSCLLIIVYFLDELSFDKYHKEPENVYRTSVHLKWSGGDIHTAISSGLIAPALKQNFPEVEHATRIISEGKEYVKSGQQTIELSPIFTDNEFFQVLDQKFVDGNPATALTEPNSIVLSESAARRIFGTSDNVVGKTLEYINRSPQKVVAIIRDVPKQSHFTFDAIGYLDPRSEEVNGGLDDLSLYTYIRVKNGTNIPRLQSRIDSLFTKQLNGGASATYKVPLQALTSIHLHSSLPYELGANGNILYLYIFISIAGIILLLACINYINLATAQSIKRAKEVGIRKVMGSARWQLITQYFTESFLLVLAASVLSIFLIELVSPVLANITGKELSIWNQGVFFVLGLMAAAAFVVGILSGIYPAIFLSGYKPIAVLKGVFSKNPSGSFFRKSLVVFQFTISTALIAFTWLTYKQMNFSLKKDLGFTKDQIVGIRIPSNEMRLNSLTAFKDQLLRSSLIQGVAMTTNPIGNNDLGSTGYFLETNGAKPEATTMITRLGINTDFIPVMQIPVVAGRNFSPDIASDSSAGFLVNESLVKSMGWKDPVGKRVWNFTDRKGNTREGKVIGVVRDFHIASLHKKIEPLIMYLAPKNACDNVYAKLNAGDVTQSLSHIEKTFRQFDNYYPFETYFLDQNFANQYEEDNKKGSLFLVFTMLAIFIACLGLFGLIKFTVEQRSKELSIRKVLGASVQNLLFLLSKDFLILVSVAFVIAMPFAWWAMNAWLENWAYRTELNWWILLMAGVAALFITLLTVSVQAIRAAMVNPAKTLRSE